MGTVLIVALVFVSFCIYSLGRGIGAISDAINHDDINAVARGPVPSVQKTHTSGVPDCTAKDVSLALAAASPSVDVGGALQFTMTIRYEGSSSCLIDASNDSRVLTISSGNDVVWRSNVCTVDPVMLLMARGNARIDTLAWNTNRTGDQCAADGDLPKVNAGPYSAQLSLKGTKAVSDRVAFVVQ